MTHAVTAPVLRPKILLLAGSGEARAIATGLSHMAEAECLASFAGATRMPAQLDVPTRSGGFGGRDGQRAFLVQHQFQLVVDATHPFADAMTTRTAALCAELKIPYLHVRRPGWVETPGDIWIHIDHPEQAADHIPLGARVFLGTGRGTLARFKNLTGRRIFCRQIDAPAAPFPFENGEYVQGRPPFSVQAEIDLFNELRIDALVVKNAGGDPSRSKLDAARVLGIPVVMLRRPDLPDAPHVATPEAALNWVTRTLATL